MEVVLANGEVVVANEVEHGDLFWAMRGVSPCVLASSAHLMLSLV